MTTAASVSLLKKVTALPTGAGHEVRVAALVRSWVQARRALRVEADAFGNLTVRRRRVGGDAPPLYVTAHLDHPAFKAKQQAAKGEVCHHMIQGGDRRRDAVAHPRVRVTGREKRTREKRLSFALLMNCAE